MQGNNLGGGKFASFNQAMTFEEFLADSGNQLARDVAFEMAVSTTHVPFYIYADHGMGKTHLLQAIGHKTGQLRPQNNVRYIHAERYVYQTYYAAELLSYDMLNVLMIDDIECIAGKWKAQEVLLATLQALIGAGKKVVFASTQHPHSLREISPELMNIFGGSLMVKIQPLCLETKFSYVMRKLCIEENAGRYIAQQSIPNYRKLEAVVNFIRRSVDIKKQVVSVELIDELFAPFRQE